MSKIINKVVVLWIALPFIYAAILNHCWRVGVVAVFKTAPEMVFWQAVAISYLIATTSRFIFHVGFAGTSLYLRSDGEKKATP